jgi:signal transduction histidine kinase
MLLVFRSIRTKVSVLFILLFVAILTPLFLNIFSRLKFVLQEASKNEMLWEAEKLLQVVRFDPLSVPVSSNYDVQIKFFNEETQQVIFASPDFPMLSLENSLIPYFSVDTVEIANVSRQSPNGQGSIILSIKRNNSVLEESLQDLKTYLITASGIAIMLAALLAHVITGWMLNPIRTISKAATKITASEKIDRVPVPNTKDESQVLAEALNSMLTRIESTIRNQTNFFASATHELKTPLAIMKAELTSVKSDFKTDGLLEEVERLDRVINDFLLISQLKSDSLQIRKTKQPVEEIIYRAIKKMTLLKKQYGTHITITLDSQNAEYLALVDGDKMENVFINLFENAIRYSKPSSFFVSIQQTEFEVLTIVTNPIGEPVANLPNLVNEFQKSKELSDGLGMGLWICNQIVKLHDGRLILESEDELFKASVILPLNG